jgi:aspartate racemase
MTPVTQGRSRMLLVGMLGGMSWESTAEYYRLANEIVRERLGGCTRPGA